MDQPTWWIMRGTRVPDPHRITLLPATPPWRPFAYAQQLQIASEISENDRYWNDDDERYLAQRAERYWLDPNDHIHHDYLNAINAALYLRRPLLISGNPGIGKSSLAYVIAHELCLGPVLYWPISSRTTVSDGLYSYDGIARLQETSIGGESPPIGDFIRLRPLGQAFVARNRPRVLLIDELDKSSLDFPNDLLHLFEEGRFEITELKRGKTPDTSSVQPFHSTGSVPIDKGEVICKMFPIVIMTDNGERAFPPAFLRRCIRLEMVQPNASQLSAMIETSFGQMIPPDRLKDFIDQFMNNQPIAVDQLLNAVHISGLLTDTQGQEELRKLLMRPLNEF
jgi:MoxR-like ATPase